MSLKFSYPNVRPMSRNLTFCELMSHQNLDNRTTVIKLDEKSSVPGIRLKCVAH